LKNLAPISIPIITRECEETNCTLIRTRGYIDLHSLKINS
jgi:hypothetical protein